MPVIQIENIAPDSGLGMLPFFKNLDEDFRPGVHVRGVDGAWIPPRPRIPIFGFPARPLPAPAPFPFPFLPRPVPPPANGGFLPPWLRQRWKERQAPPPVGPAPIPTPTNTGPLPPSPVVIVDHANPGDQETPATGAPSTTPATGAPVSTMTPPIPVQVVGAPATSPTLVSATTASMFAAPSSGASMFASSGAPVASSMFGTVQGSGSQVAKISGENALSGVPEGSGRTIGLIVVAGLALLTAWGFHLNKQPQPKRRRAPR